MEPQFHYQKYRSNILIGVENKSQVASASGIVFSDTENLRSQVMDVHHVNHRRREILCV